MPRDQRVLVVLVASPSDLEPERNRLKEVVKELNVTWSRTFGLQLELVRWETHGYPGIGEDAQDVLNRQLPEDPDIFIGPMWGRYGTPTGRAGSGTEEEFNHALDRYRQDPDSVRVMFYFKDAPLNPSAIDPAQLARVQEFKQSLGPEGALYWKFVSVEEFERLLRLHLARQIQEFNEKASSAGGAIAASTKPADASTSEEELGLIDFLDLVEEHFGALNEITARITTETNALGQKMQERAREANAVTAEAKGQLSRRDARALVDKAAADMTQFVVRMNAEIPLFREQLRAGG
jgi:Domain of unknown function (DUF4062)